MAFSGHYIRCSGILKLRDSSNINENLIPFEKYFVIYEKHEQKISVIILTLVLFNFPSLVIGMVKKKSAHRRTRNEQTTVV